MLSRLVHPSIRRASVAITTEHAAASLAVVAPRFFATGMGGMGGGMPPRGRPTPPPPPPYGAGPSGQRQPGGPMHQQQQSNPSQNASVPKDPNWHVTEATDATLNAIMQSVGDNIALLDFWAGWCAPCKKLTPVLESIAKASGGRIKLIKINVDDSPQLAHALRVPSIPAVFALHKGQLVDAFHGEQSPAFIEEFKNRLLTTVAAAGEGAESKLVQAEKLLRAGDSIEASKIFKELADGSDRRSAAHGYAGLARCALQSGDHAVASQLTKQVKEKYTDYISDVVVSKTLAAVELASVVDGLKVDRSLDALEEVLKKDPHDIQARYELAVMLLRNGEQSAAMDHLLTIMRKNRAWNENAAKGLLLKVFTALGPANSDVQKARKQLSTLVLM
eukprot:TRINITY_DN8500_c0_g1::TRINITY_DN8500_c0_g1_i1::g.3449::m.3449 TRINITY_DN8500_c0_g1::TRINITY_DN8500_c0_g1_i1::g.3449  ORF type:complete len:390 (-),score=42.25,sp/P08058/THIO_RHOSH/40.74/6e-16,TPR_20/PF14561.1/2.1e+03,TPR_20/PF14561.1/4.1e-23,Thioredoxin/PF00085.15/1.1e-18,TPR_16/PF13432.1/0.016,TPR_16/PF13432.1/1e-05,TPR_19/PF14559.1/0.0022,TPR_19/PF14559.1/0.0012,Thioredoxin_8/PF13905.1/1.5e-06,Thioredoxin_8/PF13905.1/1.1e+03,Thioredoxin_8/PF13905.1/2.2e+03,TPR_11/PF13414.1/8.6,TPR_11/PF13414.1